MTYYGGKELAAAFRTVRKNTVQIAEEIPENKYDFKPSPEARTVAQTLAHVALSPQFYTYVHSRKITDMGTVNFQEVFGPIMAEEQKPRSKAELVEMLKTDGEKFAAFLEGLTEADLGRQQNNLKNLELVRDQFSVRAPAPGMVIYVREWNGKKKGVGSMWNAWESTVATLPDLTQMESQTYVNEVDVRKLSLGQKVVVSLDADPTKKLNGSVTQIANVGEQRPNQDSKVFEVKIEIATPDTTLRPGMTTSNAIETASLPNVLSVPLEAVVTEAGFSYVFKKSGRGVVKQMVETGAMNDNEIVVRRGVEAGDRVLLAPPTDQSGISTSKIPGLMPTTAPIAGGDTAKSVKMPSKAPAAPAPAPSAAGGAAPAPAPKR